MLNKYSIGITTYSKRFTKYFKPLLMEIKSQRPDIEIIVNINSEYNQPIDNGYRKEILEFCAQYSNIVVSFWPTFRGLSTLWNDCIRRSSHDYILLLNDDVVLAKGFFDYLEQYNIPRNSLISSQKIYPMVFSFVINNSWSHVFLNRSEVDNVGWFDERFLGVGEEDGDFELRYHESQKHAIAKESNFYIHNVIAQEDCLNGQIKVHKKYSKFNRDFLFEKYPKTSEDDSNKRYFYKYEWPFTMGITNSRQYPYEYFYWANRNSL